MKTPPDTSNILPYVLVTTLILQLLAMFAGTHNVREPLRLAGALSFVSVLLLHRDAGMRICGIVLMLLYGAMVSWGVNA